MDRTTTVVENVSNEPIQRLKQPGSVCEMEQQRRQLVWQLGGPLVRLWLKWEEGQYSPKEKFYVFSRVGAERLQV